MCSCFAKWFFFLYVQSCWMDSNDKRLWYITDDIIYFYFPFFLYNSGGGPGTPTDLVTSEVTYYSFRATWMPPDEPVEKFRIEYVPAAGGKTEVVSAIDTFVTSRALLSCLLYLLIFIYIDLFTRCFEWTFRDNNKLYTKWSLQVRRELKLTFCFFLFTVCIWQYLHELHKTVILVLCWSLTVFLPISPCSHILQTPLSILPWCFADVCRRWRKHTCPGQPNPDDQVHCPCL